jgi:hypothetical protein
MKSKMVFLLLDQNLEVLNYEVFPQSTRDDDDSDDNVQCCCFLLLPSSYRTWLVFC